MNFRTEWIHAPMRRRPNNGQRSNLEGCSRSYREGCWDCLARLNELAHLAILGGYFRQL